MSEFISRSARFELEATVSFTAGAHSWDGYCVNVSESGMLAKFFSPLSIWEMGELAVELDGHTYLLGARVAREEAGCFGLAFQIRGESDRQAIRALVARAGGIY